MNSCFRTGADLAIKVQAIKRFAAAHEPTNGGRANEKVLHVRRLAAHTPQPPQSRGIHKTQRGVALHTLMVKKIAELQKRENASALVETADAASVPSTSLPSPEKVVANLILNRQTAETAPRSWEWVSQADRPHSIPARSSALASPSLIRHAMRPHPIAITATRQQVPTAAPAMPTTPATPAMSEQTDAPCEVDEGVGNRLFSLLASSVSARPTDETSEDTQSDSGYSTSV